MMFRHAKRSNSTSLRSFALWNPTPRPRLSLIMLAPPPPRPPLPNISMAPTPPVLAGITDYFSHVRTSQHKDVLPPRYLLVVYLGYKDHCNRYMACASHDAAQHFMWRMAVPLLEGLVNLTSCSISFTSFFMRP